MAFCQKFSGRVLSGDNHVTQHRLRCKMWSCPYCATVNAKIWRVRLLKSAIKMLNEKPETEFSFITITLDSKYHAQTEQASIEGALFIQKNWDALSKRLKRWLGNYQYVRVLESHKDGTLHIHLLITVHLPDVIYYYTGKGKNRKKVGNSAILQGHLIAIGFGKIHDVKNLEKQGENETHSALKIIAYVLKYVSKSLVVHDKAQRQVRLRKILTSQGFIRVKNNEFEDSLELWVFRYGRLRKSEFDLYLSLTDTRTGMVSDDEFIGEVWIGDVKDDL